MSRWNPEEAANNIAAQWEGTDPMRSIADVRRALAAMGDEVPRQHRASTLRALLPKLCRDGMLVGRACARSRR